MGFPLRSNIFRDGTYEQTYFSQFPIQVAVLFSPIDQDFVDAFRDIFLELDKLTGDDVAFFAVLDPPLDWLKEARNRPWWQEYTSRIGQIGFSIDDRVLFREIMRLFDLGWSQLPQIVVGTNLWTGEFVKFPTSPFHIQRQLEALAKLVRELEQPNIDHIAERLSEDFGSEAQYHPPDNALIDRFSSLYGMLDIVTVEGPDRTEQYARILNNELRQVENTLERGRRRGDNREQQVENLDVDENLNSSATDSIIEDAAGRLVAPATVAMQIFERFHRGRVPELIDRLEEESLVMTETAIRIGDFLVNLESGPLREVSPLRSGRRGRNDVGWQSSHIDFTPAAQGIWKTFELEVNFSLIQAARASISISMPKYFAAYDSGLPAKSDKIVTVSRNGKAKPHYINQRDRNKQTGRHKFLTIGDALAVAQNRLGNPDYENIISMCLGHPLPIHLFNAWERIQAIRNKGSHVEPLQEEDYKEVLETVFSLETLDSLIQIKRRLSSLPPFIVSTSLDDTRKAESYKREVEELRNSNVAGQIFSYYEKWKQIKAQEAQMLLAKAIVEKVRKAGREKPPTTEKQWYKELLAFVVNKRNS